MAAPQAFYAAVLHRSPACQARSRGAAFRLAALLVAVLASSATLAMPVEAEESATVPLAAAFEQALAAHDADRVLALFAGGGMIKERNAVLAAGKLRLAGWIADCLVQGFSLVPGSRQIAGDTVSWAFQDWSDCYWRSRRGELRPARSVFPAEGTATIVVRDHTITVFIYAYSADWEAHLLAAMVAPIRTAQAQATQRAVQSSATPMPQADPPVGGEYPRPPGTQGRTTPSPVLWGVAVVLTLLGAGCAGWSADRSNRLKR